MDTFILAATSFIIAVSLMITGKKDTLQTAFSRLCAAVFLSQAAISLNNIFHVSFLLKLEYIGSLAIAPLALAFLAALTRNRHVISGRLFIIFTLLSLCGSVFVFTPLSDRSYFRTGLLYYTFCALILGYFILMWNVKKLSSGDEKRRLGYLLSACPIAFMLGNIDLFNYWGLELPVVSGIVSSALLYFMLLVIAYPQLHELHDFLGRSLVIFVSTLAGTVIFYLTAGFFNGNPPLTGLLVASFLVVISLSPMRMILRKIFNYFYPESKDIFTSLYEFDEKLEREKAMMLAEMAPVVAHEIRNPLGSIKGAAQYLRAEASTPEQKELLDIIVEDTDRLNTVVSQFLDYARPYNLNPKPQNLNLIIKKAVSVIAANRLLEHTAIVQELDENLPNAAIDEQPMMQVIINIALNAIESMPGGGTLTFCTSVDASDVEGEITFTIHDTGSGISSKDLKDIFKPFFTTKKRGVGLGLAICQKIIKDHEGSIAVRSMPSRGTAFIIKLKTVP